MSPAFRLIVGLGNPGRQYESTRHNFGFMALDTWCRQENLLWSSSGIAPAWETRLPQPSGRPAVQLVKPKSYMNLSGGPVQRLLSYHRLDVSQLLVVHDEIQLPLGRIKCTVGGGAGGHNGIAHLLTLLPPGFTRLRLGIGPKTPPQIDLADFVLGQFSPEESNLLPEILERAVHALRLLITKGSSTAMNFINQKPDPSLP